MLETVSYPSCVGLFAETVAQDMGIRPAFILTYGAGVLRVILHSLGQGGKDQKSLTRVYAQGRAGETTSMNTVPHGAPTCHSALGLIGVSVVCGHSGPHTNATAAE